MSSFLENLNTSNYTTFNTSRLEKPSSSEPTSLGTLPDRHQPLASASVPHLPHLSWLKPPSFLPVTLTQPSSFVSSNSTAQFLTWLLQAFTVTPYSVTILAILLSSLIPDKKISFLFFISLLWKPFSLTILSRSPALCRALNSTQPLFHKAFVELKSIYLLHSTHSLHWKNASIGETTIALGELFRQAISTIITASPLCLTSDLSISTSNHWILLCSCHLHYICLS